MAQERFVKTVVLVVVIGMVLTLGLGVLSIVLGS